MKLQLFDLYRKIRKIEFKWNVQYLLKITNYCVFLATVFGDPHVYTFDHMDYTFNGLGEYVLVRADSPRVKIDVQVTHVYLKLARKPSLPSLPGIIGLYFIFSKRSECF